MSVKAVIFCCGNCVLSTVHCRWRSYELCFRHLLLATGLLQRIGGVSRYDSDEHVLRDKLNWPPIMQRSKFKVGVFGYKAINSLVPSNCKDFFVPVSSISALSRNRSAGRWEFIIPSATKNITYRRRSFAVAGPTLWKLTSSRNS